MALGLGLLLRGLLVWGGINHRKNAAHRLPH